MELNKHLSDRKRVLFAIPKKGRLHQHCLDLLQGAGKLNNVSSTKDSDKSKKDIQFSRFHRLDIAIVQNLPIALIFLPAADIPRFVGEGNVDLGITGQDQVAESAGGDEIQTREILQLGFGKCKLQVQVPEHGEITSPEQLIGRRVVSSFTKLASDYFNKLGAPTNGSAIVKYVGGSVEAACALGVAEGIVDLVESGETMRAAGLKAIATVMTSQAVLIGPPKPHSDQEVLIGRITARIRGVISAKRYVLCTYNVPRDILHKVTKITPGKRAPTVTPLEDADWVAVSAMVEKVRVAEIMDDLEAEGCSDILITEITNSRA